MCGRSISLTLILIFILILVGCDRGDATFLEPEIDRLTTAPTGEDASRVFDGRDSLVTGVAGPTATKDNFELVTQFVGVLVDGEGVIEVSTGLDPTTELVERNTDTEGTVLQSPAGEPVTWGTFRAVSGAIIVKCTETGTHSVVHFSSLIPEGTYALWIDVFEAGTTTLLERFEFTDPAATENTIRASGEGEGHAEGMMAPTSISDGNGGSVDVSNCMLSDVKAERYDWQVVGTYQNPIGSAIEQIGFVFETDQRIEKPL